MGEWCACWCDDYDWGEVMKVFKDSFMQGMLMGVLSGGIFTLGLYVGVMV